MEEIDIEKVYDNIVVLTTKYCHKKPYPGFEINYLEKAEKVYDVYKTAGGILDDLNNALSEAEEKEFKELLKNQENELEKLVN